MDARIFSSEFLAFLASLALKPPSFRGGRMRLTETEDMTTAEAPAEFIEATLDLPIRYIDRSRNYYLSLGYDNPYQWAHNREVPFVRMKKRAREARITL